MAEAVARPGRKQPPSPPGRTSPRHPGRPAVPDRPRVPDRAAWTCAYTGPITGLKPAMAWSGAMKHTLAQSPGIDASVARVAAEQELGEFIDARSWGGRQYVLAKLAASGGCLAGMALIIGLLHFLYIFSVFLLFYFVWGISNAIAAAIRGPQFTALYANGIAATSR